MFAGLPVPDHAVDGLAELVRAARPASAICAGGRASQRSYFESCPRTAPAGKSTV